MNGFFKNLINQLNALNGPIHIETEEEENRRLSDDLEKRKFEIRSKNYFDIMNNRLIPFIRDKELSDSGILLTDAQLFERAHELFCRAKRDGKFDELNKLIEVKTNEL